MARLYGRAHRLHGALTHAGEYAQRTQSICSPGVHMKKTVAKSASSTRTATAPKKVAAKKVATGSAAKKVATKKTVAKKVVARKAAGRDAAVGVSARKPAAKKAPAKKVPAGKSGNGISPTDGDASRRIDARIAELGDWRGPVLARVRQLILQAEPRMVEEVKWRGVPVWSCEGIVCTGETYKEWVKMTFAHGARLEDPAGLFNSSLEGNTRRAIDIRQGEKIDGPALKALVRRAVAFNESKKRKPAKAA